jgi:ABC-type nitrate/sulfonate/bicarbonate transport system substrate-binding protein
MPLRGSRDYSYAVGARLQDLTKAMATGQMWTQAQPAERACRGAAAAERRVNGVAYTAPKSRLPKKTER